MKISSQDCEVKQNNTNISHKRKGKLNLDKMRHKDFYQFVKQNMLIYPRS